ncbi:hypothetical protein RHMOL_Rhmol01G0183600 [Rhododendron molle]|uniref:Uncharacterized protein n=1 Tax=Rhododendron molle TaxID=49168 RepID=A0ACC0Q467_RHOML|nr:hypothetical protein RHMOL_Rhmol01G0183600 [Rhododendron molle]
MQLVSYVAKKMNPMSTYFLNAIILGMCGLVCLVRTPLFDLVMDWLGKLIGYALI